MEEIQRVVPLCNTWTDMHNSELDHSQIPARSTVVEEPEFITSQMSSTSPDRQATMLWFRGAIIRTKDIKNRFHFHDLKIISIPHAQLLYKMENGLQQ